jgi:hypothetical protein
VIPALLAAGYEVMALQFWLTPFAADEAPVRRTINRVGGLVILVGQSMAAPRSRRPVSMSAWSA